VFFSYKFKQPNNLSFYKPGFALVAWHVAEVQFHVLFQVGNTYMAMEEIASLAFIV